MSPLAFNKFIKSLLKLGRDAKLDVKLVDKALAQGWRHITISFADPSRPWDSVNLSIRCDGVVVDGEYVQDMRSYVEVLAKAGNTTARVVLGILDTILKS